MSADSVKLRRYFVPALFAGISFGMAARLLAADVGKGAAAAGGVVGIALLSGSLTDSNSGLALKRGDNLSPADLATQQIFLDAFHERLKERQRRAVFVGVLGGAIAGAGVVQLILPSIFGG